MAEKEWDEDVVEEDITPPQEWNLLKDRLVSIAGDRSVEDGFLRLKQGTLEDRPAPVMEGRLYYATDEGVWYRDSGTEWKELVREEGEIRLVQLGEKDYSSLDEIPSEFTPEEHGNEHAEGEKDPVDHDDLLGGDVSDAHHSKTEPSEIDSENWDDYEIQKDGEDGDGIINFKTE